MQEINQHEIIGRKILQIDKSPIKLSQHLVIKIHISIRYDRMFDTSS